LAAVVGLAGGGSDALSSANSWNLSKPKTHKRIVSFLRRLDFFMIVISCRKK